MTYRDSKKKQEEAFKQHFLEVLRRSQLCQDSRRPGIPVATSATPSLQAAATNALDVSTTSANSVRDVIVLEPEPEPSKVANAANGVDPARCLTPDATEPSQRGAAKRPAEGLPPEPARKQQRPSAEPTAPAQRGASLLRVTSAEATGRAVEKLESRRSERSEITPTTALGFRQSALGPLGKLVDHAPRDPAASSSGLPPTRVTRQPSHTESPATSPAPASDSSRARPMPIKIEPGTEEVSTRSAATATAPPAAPRTTSPAAQRVAPPPSSTSRPAESQPRPAAPQTATPAKALVPPSTVRLPSEAPSQPTVAQPRPTAPAVPIILRIPTEAPGRAVEAQPRPVAPTQPAAAAEHRSASPAGAAAYLRSAPQPQVRTWAPSQQQQQQAGGQPTWQWTPPQQHAQQQSGFVIVSQAPHAADRFHQSARELQLAVTEAAQLISAASHEQQPRLALPEERQRSHDLADPRWGPSNNGTHSAQQQQQQQRRHAAAEERHHEQESLEHRVKQSVAITIGRYIMEGSMDQATAIAQAVNGYLRGDNEAVQPLRILPRQESHSAHHSHHERGTPVAEQHRYQQQHHHQQYQHHHQQQQALIGGAEVQVQAYRAWQGAFNTYPFLRGTKLADGASRALALHCTPRMLCEFGEPLAFVAAHLREVVHPNSAHWQLLLKCFKDLITKASSQPPQGASEAAPRNHEAAALDVQQAARGHSLPPEAA